MQFSKNKSYHRRDIAPYIATLSNGAHTTFFLNRLSFQKVQYCTLAFTSTSVSTIAQELRERFEAAPQLLQHYHG